MRVIAAPDADAAIAPTRTAASLLLIIVILVAFAIAGAANMVLADRIYGERGLQPQIDAQKAQGTLYVRQVADYELQLEEQNRQLTALAEARLAAAHRGEQLALADLPPVLATPPLQERVEELERLNAKLKVDNDAWRRANPVVTPRGPSVVRTQRGQRLPGQP
jgi:hypothetical protein